MKLLEYEAKNILKKYGAPVPKSTVIKGVKEEIAVPVVLKSQVPVGGRGKAGGVKIIEKKADIPSAIATLLKLSIKGLTPTVLLAEEKLAIKRELYLSLLIDRSSASIRLIAHHHGGIEVEANDTKDFFNKPINTATILERSEELAHYLNLDSSTLTSLVQKLFTTFTGEDATLLEINPLVVTNDGALVCGDCKMELDDAAQFRHPDWQFEDTPKNANFVTLNPKGNVATIANGAGLAMATVDAVKAGGMEPANFLDIGGGATTESVLEAFKKIQEFSGVKAIVINIFAGITRCDQIALAVIEAKKHMKSLPPLYIRLAGTNFEEAVALLTEEDIPTLATLEDCLVAAKEAL